MGKILIALYRCFEFSLLSSRRIFPTVDGVRNTLRILERVDPKFGRLKAENLVDDRIVRKLEKDGVFK